MFDTFTGALLVQLLALGLATGFCAGLLGIGGGMLMVPFLTLILTRLGVADTLAVKCAIATSMASIVFTAISSVRAHHARGAVQWSIVRQLSPGIVLGAAVASLGVFALLKGQWLALIFGVFVAFSATQMLLNRKPAPSRQMPQGSGAWGAGALIGFVSGLVGAGGGFISVPFMVWCNVAVHQAVATSAALGFPIALANAAGYAIAGHGAQGLPTGSIGFIWVGALVVICAASVCTAPVGARVAHTLPVERLKRVFALVLYALAAYMAAKGLGWV
jgi:uncharacterized protein